MDTWVASIFLGIVNRVTMDIGVRTLFKILPSTLLCLYLEGDLLVSW